MTGSKGSAEPITLRLDFDERGFLQNVLGTREEHLQLAEEKLGVKIVARGNSVRIIGLRKQTEQAREFFNQLRGEWVEGYIIDQFTFNTLLDRVLINKKTAKEGKFFVNKIEVPSKKRFISPRTEGQRNYIKAMAEKEIVFSIGPAGTGKTYLAMAMGVWFLTKGEVSRIVLVRPAVEAGEKLGFLPGDMQEKVMPYLRPLYDALYDMVDPSRVQRFIDTGVIEVAPLAFMRGRTLNDAFVILDEAQNTTDDQMKMFLTRLGFNSRTVVTGDVTQIDLPENRASGLLEAEKLFDGIKGIAFCYLTQADVVRHHLVQKIVNAYEERNRAMSRENKNH